MYLFTMEYAMEKQIRLVMLATLFFPVAIIYHDVYRCELHHHDGHSRLRR